MFCCHVFSRLLCTMLDIPLTRPCDRSADALLERHLRLVVEQFLGKADIGDIARDLADTL